MKILLVDDEYVSLKKLEIIMADWGECRSANSGEEALELFFNAHREKAPFDICMLDLMMPGIKGNEVVQKIRQFELDHIKENLTVLKIILVSGADDFTDIFNSYSKGCESYLIKPINKEKITAALKDLQIN